MNDGTNEAGMTPVGGAVRRPTRAPSPNDAKEMSPRERAAARTAELMKGGGGVIDEGVDEFHIDPAVIPDGWSYEWKARTILGAEDPAYQVSLARKGWESVPVSRHPEMMPVGYTGKEITRKGMVLMERPQEISDQARSAELRKARLQVRAKEEQLSAAPAGQFERTNKGNDMAKVKKGYEAMPIPEE